MQIFIALIIGLIVAVYVLMPLFRGPKAFHYDWDGTRGAESRDARREQVERDVVRYREAIRAGTICVRCARANSVGSRFCAECGRPLAGEQKSESEPQTVSG